MIFVTVGTHEQGMERLLIKLDNLIEQRKITEEIIAQIGYTSYKPKSFKYMEMIGYEEMDNFVKEARVVISHGGPGSIFHALQYNKIPIVVPRNPKFNEHVDEHQILFTKKLEEDSRVIGIYDINDLEYKIKEYESLSYKCARYKNNSSEFIKKFQELVSNKLEL